MKKTLIALSAIFTLVWLPAAVSAQGFPPRFPGGPRNLPLADERHDLATPGAPEPAGPPIAGPPPLCGPPPGGMAPPSGCSQQPGACGKVYGGYVFDLSKGLRYVREAGLGNGNTDLGLKAPFRGAWLGLSMTSAPTCGPGYRIAAGFLIPNTASGDLFQNETTALPVTGDLSSRNEWWYLDGAGTYTVTGDPCNGLFQAVGGLRWDYFKATQSIAASDEAGGSDLNESATNILKVSAWLPYAGLQYRMISSDSRFLARAVGLPWLWGQVTFNDSSSGTSAQVPFQGSGQFSESLKDGYFLEFFGEYARTISCSIEAGAFAKVDLIHAQTQVGDYVSSVDGPRQEQIRYDRRSLTVGGLVSLSFNTF